MTELQAEFGAIDIYLFDQILRERIWPGMRILDAGCGGGRNLVYLLRQGYEVFGVDQDPAAIHEVRRLAAQLAPALPASHFQVASIEEMPYPDHSFDFVISNAVLHFAQDRRQFEAMLSGLWRVLKPSGLLFCRVGSKIGIQDQVRPLGHGVYLLPDGSAWYLVDERMLEDFARRWNASLADPIKTTVVQDQRAMTTWVLRKE